ncbi:Threonylcarbamoyl-AMP synthase [Gracilariopsis chorda]|uniref:Threonylcarbamoyl-AMP synthase n=1 Tax=Gracilariopsis chorda TaxID=448386 RepID=A0A2V3IVU9_9FLOR|nr:Threonylcarbamoyl-AMP synthase [Gracilariopsis chorda]|eukprot:PXF46205.1 Threonylcarbamoyl-AMP synthase [Gracilariopsis chorda]
MPTVPSKAPAPRIFCGTNELDITHAAAALRSGQLVAFPTETVYGLGANALDPSSVSRIFEAKGRPSDNPLIVHVSSLGDISRYRLTPPLPPIALRLAASFWPGPLTMVLPLSRHARLAAAVTAGLPSVAIRIPKHPIAAALLAKAAIPIAAPSANLSGRPSPTTAHHVLQDLRDRIYGIVDGGKLQAEQCGLESTVVDLTDPTLPTILRPGAVSKLQLEAVAELPFSCPKVSSLKPKAPGMKYRHYAPKPTMRLVSTGIEDQISMLLKDGKKVGLLADEMICDKWRKVDGVAVVPCGKHGSTDSFAQELYGALRAFDGEGEKAVEYVDMIIAVPPSNVVDGIGEAVMNRLRKAAAGGDLKS